MAESSYMIAPGESSDSLSMRKKLALALAQKNLQPLKIEHWAQGLAHLGDQAYSGYEIGKIAKDEKEETGKGNALLAQMFGGAAPAPQAAAPVADAPRAANVSTPMGDPMAGDPSQPRGYRNNNPLNIEAGNFTKGQPGFSGSDGRFAKFASMDQGVGAANTLLDTYEKKHGLNTVAGILSRWAPASDGNNVSAYATNVSKQLGIDPNAPVPPEMRQKLIAAMAQHENGKPMPAMAAGPQMAQAPQAAPGGVNKDMLIQMLGNRKTAPMAQAIMQSTIAKQFEPEKPTDDIKEYERAQKDPKFKQYLVDMKSAGRTQINNNVGGGSDKQIFDSMDESAKGARTTAAGLTSLREARGALEGGAITGFGANQVLDVQKLGAALGLANSDKIVNTETFRAAIAPQVSAVLKSTVGTANISNTDREFAEKAAGGNITLDGKSISRLLNIMEKASIAQLEGHQKRLDKVYTDPEKYGRERALFGVDMPAAIPMAPKAAPPPASPSGAVKVTTPDEARKLPKGTKIILPDGTQGVVP